MNSMIVRRGAAFATVMVTVAVGGCTPAPTSVPQPAETIATHADYPAYKSLKGAVEAAEVIVVGTWLSSRDAVLYPDDPGGDDPVSNPQAGVKGLSADEREQLGVPITISSIRLERVIKGAGVKTGSVIQVNQAGGQQGNTVYREEGVTFLKDVTAKQVLLFLNDFGAGVYEPLNPTEGAWAVADDGLLAISKAMPFFQIQSLNEVSAEVASLGER